MKLYLFIRIIIIYGCECFRDRLRLSLGPQSLLPRSAASCPSPLQHLNICRYLRQFEILFIWFSFLGENSASLLLSLSCLRPPLPLNTCINFIMEQNSGLGKSGWKIPILIAGQRETHVRVPQDRLPALHIYVRNIVDTSSSLCCATWRTTSRPSLCLPQSFTKQQQPKLLSFAYPVRN